MTRPQERDPAHAGAQPKPLYSLIGVLGAWLIVGAVYWPSAAALNRLWMNTAEETYTHGYLILALSLWLTYRERQRLAAATVRPVLRAAIPLLLLSAVWVWAWRADIQELHLMLLPLILITAIIGILGWQVARITAFPVFYLYFALPFWSGGNFILQAMSSKATGALMWLSGISGFMRGNFIHLPGGTVQIAGGCSGLHEFIVGLALAALYCKLFELPRRDSLRAIGLMAILAVVVNWIRIFVVVVAADVTDMRSSLVRNHYWLGWWLFAVVFAAYLWWMERKPTPHPSSPATATTQRAATLPDREIASTRAPTRFIIPAIALIILIIFAVSMRSSLLAHHYWFGWALSAAALAICLAWWLSRNQPTRHQDDESSPGSTRTEPVSHRGTMRPAVSALIGLVALSLLPVTAYALDWAQSENTQPAVTIEWPAAPNGWEGPERAYASEWKPYFIHSSAQALMDYTDSAGQTVQVFVVAYRRQTQRAKLLGYWNRLLGKSDALRKQSQRIVDGPTGHWRQTRVIDPAGMRSIIWTRDRIGHRIFVDPRLSQLWYGVAALVSPPLSSMTAFRTACEPTCRAARARLSSATAKLQPTLR